MNILNDTILRNKRLQNNNFVKQGAILAAASIFSRIIGLLYRSPMVAVIGDDGIGIYSFAFEIYSIALILSSYSIPLAVSKLLSAKFATGQYKNAYRIFRLAMLFALASGTLMMCIIFFSADFIEKISNYPGLALPLKVLAPTILVVAIVGTIRGLFQSKRSMIPTAMSQISDQIINAIVSVLAALLFVKMAKDSTLTASYGAAGGTLGTLFGALSSLFFLGFLYTIFRPRMKAQIRADQTVEEDSVKDIIKMLLFTIVPVILSQTIYQLSGLIDGFLFGNLHQNNGALSTSELYGIYSSKYRLMVNVPSAISSALASSMIPTMVALYAVGNIKSFKKKLKVAVKFNMVVAFPCAAGLMALAQPIMMLLFPSTENTVAANMLVYGSLAVIFYALSTVTNAALQGMDLMRIPVIHATISLVIHIVLVIILLLFTDLGAYALIIGNVTYPLVVCILNWIAISRHSTYRQELKTTFVIPFAASLIMGIAVFLLNFFLDSLLPSGYLGNAINLIICLIVAIPVFFILLFIMKGLTEKDLPDFPMGMRLGRLAKKLKLLD